jgi:hypothetical protein
MVSSEIVLIGASHKFALALKSGILNRKEDRVKGMNIEGCTFSNQAFA